jgi:hypothetical protein
VFRHLQCLIQGAAAAGSVVRGRRRLFHPVGVVVAGVLDIEDAEAPVSPSGILASPGPHSVVVRLSKALATTGERPDFLGVAVRTDPDGERGDLLFVSAGNAIGLRHMLLPATDWLSASYTTLAPMQTAGGSFVLGLQPIASRRVPASMAALVGAISERPISARLLAAPVLGDWRQVGSLVLRGPVQSDEQRPLTFQPVLRPPDGLRPGRLHAALREPAYEGSQRARGAIVGQPSGGRQSVGVRVGRVSP